jgi:hypothetical protein
MRAQYNSMTRMGQINDFNDKTNNIDCFITSSSLSFQGFNIQKACARMLALEPVHDIPVLAQLVARIHRIGQEKDCYVDLIYLKNSFDGWMTSRALRKYVDSWAGETPLREVFKETGEAFKVILHEILRAKLGLPFLPYHLDQDSNHSRRIAEYFAVALGSVTSTLLDTTEATTFGKEYDSARYLRLQCVADIKHQEKLGDIPIFTEVPNGNTFPVLPEDFSLTRKHNKRCEYNLDFYSSLLGEENDTFKFIQFMANNRQKYILNEDDDGESVSWIGFSSSRVNS